MGYSTKDIERAREYIKKDIVEGLFSQKGGSNFASLCGRDIEYIFNLYDEVFFQSQIKTKIKEIPGTRLAFYASERTSGAGGVCSIERDRKECIYYLDIAPNIVNTIFKKNRSGLPLAAGIGCRDRLECLMLIIEHQIVHLLMILWGYLDSNGDSIYGSHGGLFQCMAKEYFGHTNVGHDLGFTSIDFGNSPKPTPSRTLGTRKAPPSFGYAYWSNSCYLDSLMIVMLEGVSSFWRLGLMESNIDKTPYKGICYGSKTFSEATIGDIRSYVKQIQTQIKADYRALHASPGKTLVRCTLLRKLLWRCIPELRPEGEWIIFNSGVIYEALAGLFPVLGMDVPIKIHRWKPEKKKWIPDPVEYRKIAMFTMWDYLDPLTDVEPEKDYTEIRWDNLQAHGLVFSNGGAPRIKNFGVPGVEKGINIIEGDSYPYHVTKIRAFGETIIHGRYRLVGVVTLEGISPTGEGGTHFVSYFLGRDDRWYHYNDTSARIVAINKLPSDGVWVERNGRMPSMYFYQKIRDK
jgi:hypothetical protein